MGDISVVLGTMTFGWKQASVTVDDAASKEQLDLFVSRGHTEVDTALMYAGGETEKILGRLLASDEGLASKVKIATKANPFSAGLTGSGGLSPENFTKQVAKSLESLQMPTVDLLYLHAPDKSSPIEPTLEAVNELHKQGKFRTLGLSNYQAWEVAHIYYLSKERGWVLPTVYQGMYNAITRDIERELLPCLRKLGIRFLAYNPLAAGVLTGKFRKEEPPPEGRFKGNQAYMDRYWKDSYLSLEGLKDTCEKAGMSMTEASLRWVKHHSALVAGDGVILGASRLEHLRQNLDACDGGALPDDVVAAFDAAWAACKADCPSYERGYSKLA